MNTQSVAEKFLALLKSKIGSQLKSLELNLGDVVATANRADLLAVAKILKLDSELAVNMLLDVTAVDWMDQRTERFEVVYHFLNTATGYRLRLKIAVPESDASIDSLAGLWQSANWLERETWDMYGVNFKGHPDQRRILMYDEFQGHPLRKDYPVQGKQPRVPLRSPEVRNTAVDMQRPALVQIGKNRNAAPSSQIAR